MPDSFSPVDIKIGRRPRMSRLLPQDFFPKTFSQSPGKRRPLETPNPNHLNEQPKRQSHELQICPCTEEPKMGGAKAVRSVKQLEERYCCIGQQSPQRENPRVMRHLSSYEALLQRKLKIRCAPEQEAVARINQYRITKRESRSEHSHHKGSKGVQDGKQERRRVLVSTIFMNSNGPCKLIPREGKEIRMSLGFDGMLTFCGDLKKSN